MTLKIRVWDKIRGLMSKAISLNFDDMTIVISNSKGVFILREGMYELMLSTGLLDRNGTEVYQGDIIELMHHDGNREIGHIKWSKDDAGFALYIHQGMECRHSGEDLRIVEEGTVIGNVFENKDLLPEVYGWE